VQRFYRSARRSRGTSRRLAVVEALGVATAVNTGAAFVYSTRVLNAYELITAAP
jgi:hypothetical protein